MLIAVFMANLKILTSIIFLLLAAGCAPRTDFSSGIAELEKINGKHNATMDTFPHSLGGMGAIISEVKQLKGMKLGSGQEQFDFAVDFRIKLLEAEKLFINGSSFGDSGTTVDGFSCKQRPVILESAGLRNRSAIKGFEAVSILSEFTSKYPAESAQLGLDRKRAFFLNASFFKIDQDASKDSRAINQFCPESRVLELFREDIRKKTNLSADYINNMGYTEALEAWKKLRGSEEWR